MGELIQMPGIFEATLKCGHCDYLWIGVFRYVEAIFQCPECHSIAGRVVSDVERVG